MQNLESIVLIKRVPPSRYLVFGMIDRYTAILDLSNMRAPLAKIWQKSQRTIGADLHSVRHMHPCGDKKPTFERDSHPSLSSLHHGFALQETMTNCP